MGSSCDLSANRTDISNSGAQTSSFQVPFEDHFADGQQQWLRKPTCLSISGFDTSGIDTDTFGSRGARSNGCASPTNRAIIDEPKGSVSFKSFACEPDDVDLKSRFPFPPCAPSHRQHIQRIERALKIIAGDPVSFAEYIDSQRLKFFEHGEDVSWDLDYKVLR